MTTHVLAFHEIDRVDGGHEEGAGGGTTPVHSRASGARSRTNKKTHAAAHRENRLLDRLQRHRRSIDSVIRDGGRHAIEVYEDFAPTHYPEMRPPCE